MLIKNVIVFIGMLTTWTTLAFVQATHKKEKVQSAKCKLVGSVQGTIHLEERCDHIHIYGMLKNITLGQHGMHVHEFGKTGNNCLDAGGHYNPTNMTHGGPDDAKRHVGDYGNIDVTSDPYDLDLTDHISKLSGRNSILGRSLVIHGGVDDLGRGGNPASLLNGNSGPRIACCVITSGCKRVR